MPPSTARGVPGVTSDYPPEYPSPQYLNTLSQTTLSTQYLNTINSQTILSTTPTSVQYCSLLFRVIPQIILQNIPAHHISDHFIHSPNICLISLATVILTRMSKILANTPLGLIKLIYGRQYSSRMKSQQSGVSQQHLSPLCPAPPKYLNLHQLL